MFSTVIDAKKRLPVLSLGIAAAAEAVMAARLGL
jgi:hypothetical protein